MAKVLAYEYSVALLVTVAKFRRPPNPRRCNVHRYHVWRWRSPVKLDADDLRAHVPEGMRCQCGCLTWTHPGSDHAAREETRR